MSWFIKQDTLFDEKSREIGYFLPTANPNERRLIKNGDELIKLVGEYVTDYDEKKTPLKSVINKLSKITDKEANYKITWTTTQEGELLNELEQVIFIFVKPVLYGRMLTLLPRLYSSSQELLNSLMSTNRHNNKKIYDQICDFYDQLHSD